MSANKTETPRAWGRWGADDERGALNLITADVVRAAAGAVKNGRTYSLGLPFQRAGVPNFDYRGIPQRLTLMNHDDEAVMSAMLDGPPGLGANEDVLIIPSHSITHMDALCHVYADGAHYNGFKAEGMAPYTGAARCGIQNVGSVVTRGVLLDVAGVKGVPWLELSYEVTVDDIQACLERADVELSAGCAVLLRTGWLDQFADQGEVSFAQPGLGLEAARLLASHDVAIVGADNSAVEVLPFGDNGALPVHIELLVHGGVHLIEHVNLTELAAGGSSEFLFAVNPIAITGATASPVNPVAVT